MTTAESIARIREILEAPASTMLRSTYLKELRLALRALERVDAFMQLIEDRMSADYDGQAIVLDHQLREARAEIERILNENA